MYEHKIIDVGSAEIDPDRLDELSEQGWNLITIQGNLFYFRKEVGFFKLEVDHIEPPLFDPPLEIPAPEPPSPPEHLEPFEGTGMWGPYGGTYTDGE